MKNSRRISKAFVTALLIGIVFPYLWIVFTGDGQHLDESSIDRVLMQQLDKEQFEEYLQAHMRPMTWFERISTGLTVSVELSNLYVFWSALITAVIFLINLLIWPRQQSPSP